MTFAQFSIPADFNIHKTELSLLRQFQPFHSIRIILRVVLVNVRLSAQLSQL